MKLNYNCHEQNSKNWQLRSETAVQMLLDSPLLPELEVGARPVTIADLGCGNERIKTILEARLKCQFQYCGYDLHPQSEATQKIDFEREMPAGHFDVVFALGLLEYLSSVGTFFFQVSKICNYAIWSYVIADSGIYSPEMVDSRGWKHHYFRKEIEACFQENNFISVDSRLIDGGRTCLWLVASQDHF